MTATGEARGTRDNQSIENEPSKANELANRAHSTYHSYVR